MRQKRKLAEHVWYKVETAINNREPVFQLLEAVVLFYRVLIEARVLFPFEMRGFVIGDEWLSFYIKPADGYQLPKITRWMMNSSSLSRRFHAGSTCGRGTGGDAFFQRGGFYAAAPWRGIKATPSTFRALPLAGGDHLSSVAGLCRRTVARCSSNAPSTTCCACFGRGCWSAVIIYPAWRILCRRTVARIYADGHRFVTWISACICGMSVRVFRPENGLRITALSCRRL
jgi:hypothetical protein